MSTSGLKTGRGRVRNLSSGHLWEGSWNNIWLRNKPVVNELVDYGRWTLWESWLWGIASLPLPRGFLVFKHLHIVGGSRKLFFDRNIQNKHGVVRRGFLPDGKNTYFEPKHDLKRLKRVFRCCSACETMKDYKEGYLIVWTTYISPCSSIVGLYLKGTCDVISVTMATNKVLKGVL